MKVLRYLSPAHLFISALKDSYLSSLARKSGLISQREFILYKLRGFGKLVAFSLEITFPAYLLSLLVDPQIGLMTTLSYGLGSIGYELYKNYR